MKLPVQPATRSAGAVARLKERLVTGHFAASADERVKARVQAAVDDAAALAWTTPFPLLVLPELFAEKAATARVRAARQQEIEQRSQWILSLTE